MDTKLSVNDAALKLKISPQSVKRWIHAHKLNGEKRNGKWFVLVDQKFEDHLDTNGTHPNTSEAHLNTSEAHLIDEIKHLREQLQRRDEQIDHLTQVVAMAQKNVSMLTEQLGTERQLIEDLRSRRAFWRRWFPKRLPTLERSAETQDA